MRSVSPSTTQSDCLSMYQDLSGEYNIYKADIRHRRTAAFTSNTDGCSIAHATLQADVPDVVFARTPLKSIRLRKRERSVLRG